MLTRESLYVILYSMPIYQLLFYTVQLITLSGPARPGRYLGLVLLSMTAFLVINAVYHLGYIEPMVWLYYIFVPVHLTLLPVFYLYIVTLARGNRDIDSRTRLILFLPPIVIFILNLILYRAVPADIKLTFLQNGFQPDEFVPALDTIAKLHWSGIAGLMALQLILAVIGGYKILHREADVMHRQPQHLSYLQFRWIVAICICVLLFLVSGSMFNLFGPARGMATVFVFNILMLICGGLTGYFGMKQDALLDQVFKVSSRVKETPEPTEEIEETDSGAESTGQNSTFLSSIETAQIIKDLDKVMRKEKPYLNPKFSLHDLCVIMNISRRKMTYVINEVMDKNFYGVVNDYRIEESIRLLETQIGTDYKMDSIAEMVGFNSKSSFYACFKKFTGITPTEYRIRRGGKASSTR